MYILVAEVAVPACTWEVCHIDQLTFTVYMCIVHYPYNLKYKSNNILETIGYQSLY